jgi:GDP-4-dehydro-6-deoxy-D-mannose reductase
MRVLITGATGFVGRHLSAYALSRKKVQLYGLMRRRSKDSLLPGVRAVRADLMDEKAVAAAVRKVRPERVYHLGGQASVALSWKKPEKTFAANVEGTKNLLEALRRHAPKARVLVACSAEEYGRSARKHKKLNEEAPLQPSNPYAVSKLAQEAMALHYFLEYGLPVLRTRAFNHFGPGQSDRFVVSSFAKQAARIALGKQKPEMSVGNLDAVRDFTDVRDVVRGYWTALEKGRSGDVYNVASGRGRRVEEVLRFYLRASSVKIKVTRAKARLRSTDLPRLVGDAAKLARRGWRPKIAFEQTLSDAFNDWKERLDA